MKSKNRWPLVLAWATTSSVCTFLLWVPLAAIAGSLRSQSGVASVPVAMFLYLLYSPLLAPLIIGVTVPGYFALFWSWRRVSARYPWVDAGWATILPIAAITSLPPALATAVWCARGPLGVSRGDLLAWLPFCIVMFWGALAVPRWLLDSLHPGVFSEPECEVWGHDV